MEVSIVRTNGAFGAEIRGVDLRRELSEDTCRIIRAAFYQHEVVYFRGTELTDEEQIRFSATMGQLRHINVQQFLHRGHPEILVVSNILDSGKHVGSYDAGVLWHTDGAYLRVPHDVSILRAVEVPVAGDKVLGDTLFASMTLAYEALPTVLKKQVDRLQAVHSVLHRGDQAEKAGIKSDLMTNAVRKDAEAVHPVVRIHPVTGRKCLYVTEGYTVRIVGMPPDEGHDLLAQLTRHSTNPEFRYQHNWRQHDLVMWDDCATQHKATFDYALPLRRLMHRTTVVSANPVT